MQPQSVGLLKLMLCLVCMSDIQRGDGGGGGAGWRGGGGESCLVIGVFCPVNWYGQDGSREHTLCGSFYKEHVQH